MPLLPKLSKYTHEEIKRVLNSAATKKEACKILDISRVRLNVYLKNLRKSKKVNVFELKRCMSSSPELIDYSYFNEITMREALKIFKERYKVEKRERILRELKDPY